MTNAILTMNTRQLYWQARSAIGRIWARWPGRRRCNVCSHALIRFLPYRGGVSSIPPLLRELEMVGSDVENFECPWCGSHDRERHLIFYFSSAGIFDRIPGAHVLHLAPERHLSQRIERCRPAEYIRGDLFPATEKIMRLDLQALPFDSARFDLIIANHVLEHVADDTQALREIARVLKPEGYAILQTPYSQALKRTFEDPGIKTERARLHAYGQEDHVRLYGRDWMTRFEAGGLLSRLSTHQDLLSDIDGSLYGVNMREPFMFFERIKLPLAN